MKNLFYARINRELKEGGLAVRLRVRRVPALAGFAGLLAALWWFGSPGPEALLGLVVFGAIWGGDLGPGSGGRGSDEPASPWQNRTLLSLLDGLFMRHRPRWLPQEVRGDVAPGMPEVAETDQDVLAEELLGLGLDELGRFVSRAVGWMKERQEVIWGDGPRAERHQAAGEARAIHDVAQEQWRRARGALADAAQGRRSIGEGLREVFEATDPLPLAQAVEEVRKEREAPAQQPTFGESVEIPPDVPPEAGPTPMRIPEHPPMEGGYYFSAQDISEPHQYASHFWPLAFDIFDAAESKARDFTKRMLKDGIIKKGEEGVIQNALQHFLASFTLTREFDSPSLTWNLGALNELILSPYRAWKKGRYQYRDERKRDTKIDDYHNQLGIEEAVKAGSKEVQLYDLAKRLLKKGKFRY